MMGPVSRLSSVDPFFWHRPGEKYPAQRPGILDATKRVTVKYRVIQYSFRPVQGQARADASAPRTCGSQAAADDSRAARPGASPNVQDEADRRRASDGDHAGRRESL